MTDDAYTTLAQRLGEAAAHEHAAGYFGDLIDDKLQGTLDGRDVSTLLPDTADRTHFNEYTGMLDEMDAYADDWVPDLSYREHIPDGDVDPEEALALGYAMEQEAKRRADRAKEAAEDTTAYDVFIPDIRNIGRDELREMREIEDLLVHERGWDEDDLDAITGPGDVEDVLD